MRIPLRSLRLLSGIFTGLVWGSSVTVLAETIDFTAKYGGSTATSAYTIYIPPAIETPRIKGVVFLYGGTGGDWRFRAKDPIWQDAARSLGFALIGVDPYGFSAIGSNASQAQSALQNILAAAAAATGHAELVNVPIVSTGVSLGGFSSTLWAYHNPGRVIAIAAQRGAVSFSQPSSGESLNVHTALIPGSWDSNGSTNPRVLRGLYSQWRGISNPNGRAAWAVDWMSGHDPFVKNQSWAFAWSWIAESIALRYPANTVPSTAPGNPVPLNTVPLASGWLGHPSVAISSNNFSLSGADSSSFCQVAPYSQYIGDASLASWLPNEALARVYRAFNSFDVVSTRTVIPLQGPLAIIGDAAPAASVPNQTDVPQLASWEVGTTINITLDPREFDDVRAIASMEYYDGATLLATQSAAGGDGVWSLPYTLATVGIHSLTVTATDTAGIKTSAFRTVAVPPALDKGTSYWRFESNPHYVSDQHGNITLVESTDATKRPTQVVRPAAGAGSAFPDFDNDYGTNSQALKFEVAKTQYFTAFDNALFTSGTNGQFTLEACVNLSSTDSGGTARIIAAHGGYHATDMGWVLLATAESSGRGARNLLLQTSQSGASSTLDTMDSDLQLQLGVDYYVAVVFNPLDTSAAGATFYLKDLTNNGPLQKVQKNHSFTSLWSSGQSFTIGSGSYTAYWDGLIDEVRFTNRLLGESDLLISHVATPYMKWLQEGGFPVATPPGDDLDGDGVPNLVEYALGLQNGTSGYAGRQYQTLVSEAGSTHIALTVTMPEPVPAGVGYVIEASSDLVTWSDTGLTEIANTVDGSFRSITLRDNLDLNTNPKRFMRLRITQP